MQLNKILIMVLMVIILSFSVNSKILTPNHEVINNIGYVNESNYNIKFYPQNKINSGYAYVELTTKIDTENFNIAFGFDTEATKPTSIDLKQTDTINYNPTQKTLYDVTNIETTSESCEIGSENNYQIKRLVTYNNSIQNIICINSYEQDGNNYIINYYTESIQENWLNLNNKFEKLNKNFNDKDVWYEIKDVSLEANTKYIARIYLEILSDGKYDMVFYPSRFNTPEEAYNNNKLYYIDPTFQMINNLFYYYTLDSDGTNSITEIGSDLTNYGATNTAAKINNGFLLDGSSDYMESQSYITQYEDNSITVSAWVKTSSWRSYDVFISRHRYGNSGNSWIFGTGLVGTELYFSVKNKAGTASYILETSGLNLQVNTWYFVVATYNASTGYQYIYVNGVEEASQDTTDTTGIFEGVAPLTLGARYTSAGAKTDFFNGIVDEIGIWNVSLSLAEIEEIYNNGNGLSYPFESEISNPIITNISIESDQYDTTPTFNLITDINSTCGYSETNSSYTECEITGELNHNCTFNTLSIGNNTLYFNCSNVLNSTYWSTNSTTIEILSIPAAEPEINGDNFIILAEYCKEQYLKNESIYISTVLNSNSIGINCNIDVYTYNGIFNNTFNMSNTENSTFHYINIGMLEENNYISKIECLDNTTLYYGACNFEVIDETTNGESEAKMISNVLTFIAIITFFTIMGLVVFIITKQKNIDHTNLPFWISFVCFSLAIIELIVMIGVNWLENIGGDITNILSINFYSIAIIGLGVAFISLIFILQNIFDFTITEKDREKW